MTPNLRGSLFMLASMAAFSLEDALIKQAASGMPVGQIALFIGLFGLAAFSLQSLRAGAAPLPRTLLTPVMAIRSGFEIFGRVFYALAITLTPLTSASAILQATPLIVVAGAALIFGERVGAKRWALIGLGLVGVMLVIRPSAGDFTWASLLAVGGMIGFAGRDLSTRAARASLSNAQLGASGFLMLAVAGLVLLATTPAPIVFPAPAAVPPLLGAALFATLGYGALTNAMRTGDVSVVTPFRYSRLIFALILGTVFFAERPDAMTLAGAALIVTCGALLIRR